MVTAKQPKVLLAEDDALIAMSLSQMLGVLGLEVVGVAATVTDALCIAETTRPDLAIVDVRLRGKRDGIEGAVLLRGIADIPIIFLTGESDASTHARALAIKPAAYLCKPVGAQEITAAVEQALGRPVANTAQPQPTQLRCRSHLLETASEEIAAGVWSASFAVFTTDRQMLVYWMPSLAGEFTTKQEAEQAAHSAGLEFVEHLD